MIIYCITNKINGKMYIGQTTKSAERRWYEHLYDASHGCGFRLHQAIRKYGKENFEVNVVELAHTIEELNEREKFWIDHFKTLTPNGYNLKLGGEAGGKESQATRDKKSVLARQRWSDAEYRRHMSEDNSRFWLGKKRSEEVREKMSKAKKGKTPWNKGVSGYKLQRRNS